MKTSIKTLIASSLTAILLTSTIFAGNVSATEKTPKTISATSGIKRISVKGNVEVTIIQRKAESINYTEENIGKAKVIREGDILRISSVDDRDVTKLIVYVNDLYRIEATDNAVVKTNGKLKIKFLQVFLKGNAKAELNTNTEGLYTIIKDNADLKLSGSTDNHILVMSKTPKLTIDRFAALKTNISAYESGDLQSLAVEKETAALIK